MTPAKREELKRLLDAATPKWRVRWIPMGESEVREEFLDTEWGARSYPHSGSTLLDVVKFEPSPLGADAIRELLADCEALEAERDRFKVLFEAAKSDDFRLAMGPLLAQVEYLERTTERALAAKKRSRP